MEKRYFFLFLASGVVNDEGFWLIGIKNSDKKILDDKTLLECHRKELVGYKSGKDILEAINFNIENLVNDLKKQNFFLDLPPKGISLNIPLFILENIFDFWTEKYKDQELWETSLGLLKIRRRVSLINLINSESIKGKSKRLAMDIENLHNYKLNSIKNNNLIDPMWK